MKTKFRLLSFVILLSLGTYGQSLTVTSTLPATIETGDALSFTATYDTNGVRDQLILYYYESDGTTRTAGSPQGLITLTNLPTGSETVSMDVPLVAGNYEARVFLQNSVGYAKTETTRIPFTVTAKVYPIKTAYLFETDADAEGWAYGHTGAPNGTATVAGGELTINKGSDAWKAAYIQQNEFKLDPAIHRYMHITYRNNSENARLLATWVTSGSTRTTGFYIPVTKYTNSTVSVDLTTNTIGGSMGDEWTSADAVGFRLKVLKADKTDDTSGGDFVIRSIVFSSSATPPNVFTGAIDNDWTNAGNWSLSTVPTSTSDVTIAAGKTATISSTSAAVANNLTVDAGGSLSVSSGGSLILDGTSTGNITYNVTIPDANWHLVSAPVSGETFGGATTWMADSSIASGSTDVNNRGIATYSNGTPDGTTGPWTYYNTVGGVETTFADGKGYSMKATGATTYSFEGQYPTLPVNVAISTDVNNWNLVGNPAPAYIDVAAYIAANSGSLTGGAFQALYVNDTQTSYTGLTSGYIHPGQAFFVNSNVSSGTVSTTAAVLSHQTGVTFYKNSISSISLTISDGSNLRKAYLEFNGNGTLGLDPGKDIGMFNGVDSPLSIYSNLLENNENIAFERQMLPDSDLESMIIPIGIKAFSGKEIIISATSLNLPEGLKVYLEDRGMNTFTNLNNNDLKITLNSDLNGVGRFFLHTSSKALSTSNVALENISMYKTDNTTLRIVGLQQGDATIKVFNILGRQVLNISFNANGVKDISLPKLAAGVYIVQLETETGSLNKKIILE